MCMDNYIVCMTGLINFKYIWTIWRRSWGTSMKRHMGCVCVCVCAWVRACVYDDGDDGVAQHGVGGVLGHLKEWWHTTPPPLTQPL